MIQTRLSTPGDIPRQRELWQRSFGDDGAYVDNFYRTYYKPERVLLLEEDGVVQAMTAWFDTVFAVPGRGEYRAAYLYAVATHPQARGRGLAGRLLAGADGFFRDWGIPAVTTVPAEPSLHRFSAGTAFGSALSTGSSRRRRESPFPESSPSWSPCPRRSMPGCGRPGWREPPTSPSLRRSSPIRRGAVP